MAYFMVNPGWVGVEECYCSGGEWIPGAVAVHGQAFRSAPIKKAYETLYTKAVIKRRQKTLGKKDAGLHVVSQFS